MHRCRKRQRCVAIPARARAICVATYGGFSAGPSDLEALRQYINTQEEHHRKVTFQEEHRAFLTKYGVTYDEPYMWD